MAVLAAYARPRVVVQRILRHNLRQRRSNKRGQQCASRLLLLTEEFDLEHAIEVRTRKMN